MMTHKCNIYNELRGGGEMKNNSVRNFLNIKDLRVL